MYLKIKAVIVTKDGKKVANLRSKINLDKIFQGENTEKKERKNFDGVALRMPEIVIDSLIELINSFIKPEHAEEPVKAPAETPEENPEK